WTADARSGGALSFDGISNWITLNEAPSLDFTTGMTLEAWVKPATSSGWVTVVYKEGDGVLAYGLYTSDSSAPPAMYVHTPGNPWGHALGSSMLPLNVWSHLVGTYDGTTSKVYVNGVLVGSRSLPGGAAITPGPLRIGGHNPGGQFFKGVIDEIRV